MLAVSDARQRESFGRPVWRSLPIATAKPVRRADSVHIESRFTPSASGIARTKQEQKCVIHAVGVPSLVLDTLDERYFAGAHGSTSPLFRSCHCRSRGPSGRATWLRYVIRISALRRVLAALSGAIPPVCGFLMRVPYTCGSWGLRRLAIYATFNLVLHELVTRRGNRKRSPRQSL